jgi:thimet oligopeptidase
MKQIPAILGSIIFMTSLTLGYFRPVDDAPFWTDKMSAADFVTLQEGRLKQAKESIDRMLAVKEKRTVQNTLVPFDDANVYLDSAEQQSGLMEVVHPDEKFRTASEKVSQEVSAMRTGISLNRAVYDALVAMDLKGADAETRFYVEKTLRQFRLAGVDRDDGTRAKIKMLNDELVLIGQEFGRNIRDDKSTVIVNSAADLAGLPQDFIDSHKPGKDGKLVLSIEYPDSIPVLTYAKSDDLRKRMYFAVNNRAFPQNMAVLDRMAAKRYELANLVGFKTWADYVTADKMIKSASNASDFIDKIVAASGARATREYQEMLARKRKDVPEAKSVDRWETSYYSELLRRESYNFDSQQVRPYFQYQRVKQGVLDVTARLFGVTFKQRKDAPVWDPLVECWEMFDGGKLAGRFYLDMHPRKGKYNHAAEFAIRNGVRGRQIPEASLVCNLPGADPNEPGLMEYDDVNTFFHEFGHLLHVMFAGHRRWMGTAGINTEWDFVEAPSQMLEEWMRDAKTLQTFARHYKTNEPIPVNLVAQMNRANEYGKGLTVRTQMVYARLSLSVYDRPPTDVDTDKLVKQIYTEYSPVPYVDGTHMQTSFGHLDSYSAIYYTYMWSLVIAKDMFSKFDKGDLLAPGVAKRYRQTVLEPGGSKPAEQLVEDFLGRKTSFAPYQEWLNTDAGTQK